MKLVPCPFCSGPAAIIYGEIDFRVSYGAGCDDCGACIPAVEGNDKQEAAERWNRRGAPLTGGWEKGAT